MFRTHISNRFLNEDKVITAKTQWELNLKVSNQKQRWETKEKQLKEQLNVAEMKKKALADTDASLALINQYKNSLKSSIRFNQQFDWQALYNTDVFTASEPIMDTYTKMVNVPMQDKFLEFFFSLLKNKRMEKEKEAQKLYQEAYKQYQDNKNMFLNDQKVINQSVDKFKQAYEEGITPFVERYFGTVIDKSMYPAGMVKHFDVQYLSETKSLIVDFDLPHIDFVPNVIEYKFVQTRKETITKTMKKKEFEEYYEDVLYQITLRTIYECLNSDYANTVHLIVFNGWIHGTDSSTGKDFHSCVISLQTNKEEFLSLHLEKVTPKDCFRSLKGLNAGPLYHIAPIRPILEVNRDDKRFVESKEILAGINSIPNLATMPWEDFEHLVRELFAQYFSTLGAEVKVTRASRDGGIDAVAINPDPILGGKYIIQAKRYNHVVPVSAVRELNGIMADEGALKGILVTTSHYGNDSREFVKDKPLTLIDGAILIHMLNEYGYNVRIELKNKKELG